MLKPEPSRTALTIEWSGHVTAACLLLSLSFQTVWQPFPFFLFNQLAVLINNASGELGEEVV